MKPVCLSLILSSILALPGSAWAAARDAGREVLETQGCAECHAVRSAGIKAGAGARDSKGPDLSGVARRYRADALDGYLKREFAAPGPHARGFKGTDEELQALVDWLLEQK